MRIVNVHEAKTRLSELLAEVEKGEDIVIARAGKPIARLTALTTVTGRQFGRDRNLFRVPDTFDQPLPPDVLTGFYD